MHVAITGSSGFIGTALQEALRGAGHRISTVVRRAARADDEISWDIDAGHLDPADLRGVDAVVHLAGEGIAERRWTDAQKRRILHSRTAGTRLLTEAMAAAGDEGPRVLASASAIGFYGDRGDEELVEGSPSGDGFQAEVVRAWERAADPARQAGIRVVHLRTGLVQSPGGGMLQRLLLLFRFGLGGRIADGRQWWSWVGLPDVLSAYRFALSSDIEGPVNVTGPAPVRNAQYTRTLARVLRRPAAIPVPPFAPAILLGRELTQELLLSSQRVVPERLEDAPEFAFRHRDLETCLRDLLDRPGSR